MKIADILKEKRTEHQITQEHLSKQIFVSRKTISNWELGKTTPDIDSLIRIANLFDLSLDNLLLEGSDIVENIKKQSEIRSTKIYLNCSGITNLAFLFILLTQPLFGNLSFSVLIALVIAIISNALVIIYFGNRFRKLYTGHNLNNMPKILFYKYLLKGALFGSLVGVILGIIILIIIVKLRLLT